MVNTEKREEEIIPIDDILIIPKILRQRLKQIGILGLRKFQLEALNYGIEGKNLVISAPTGSGKTLIGEILAVIRSMNDRKKTLFVVPYKALAEELKGELVVRYPFIHVGISTGDYRETPIAKLGIYDLIILTYEKADMIRREQPRWLKEVSLVVIDEIHLLSDPERGAILDVISAKFLELGYQLMALSATIKNAEEIASWLNAKLINSDYRPVKLLEGVYLPQRAKIYYYDPRPQEAEVIIIGRQNRESKNLISDQSRLDDFFKEMKSDKEIIENQLSRIFGTKAEILSVREGRIKKYMRVMSSDDLTERLSKIFYDRLDEGIIVCDDVFLVPKNIRGRGFMKYVLDLTYDLLTKASQLGTTWQILIFRRSRRLSQNTALKIAKMMEKTGLSSLFPHAKDVAKELKETLDEITPLSEELIQTLRRGVAFHHAGLTKEERRIVEKAFRERKIGVIVATPTLGAGINLPARRVVIEHYFYDPLFGTQRISVAHFKQRGGRAGRPGLDQVGEAILIAIDEDDLISLFEHYILNEPEPIRSSLGLYPPTIREQVLAYIASETGILGITLEAILNFFRRTFYYWQAERSSDFYSLSVLEENIIRSLQDLQSWGFIKSRTEGEVNYYYATRIGKKVSSIYIDPLSARYILDFLNKWFGKSKRRETKLGLKDAAKLFLSLSFTPDLSHMKLRLLSNLTTLARYILNAPKRIYDAIEDLIDESMLQILRSLAAKQYYELSSDIEDLIGSLGIVVVLLMWIEGIPIKNILLPFSPNFSGGDLRELVRISEWLLYCTKELAASLNIDIRFIRFIETIRERVEHGVTEDLLELVRIPGVGRVRAMQLKNYGYDSINKIAKASKSALTAIPGIGEKIAERILEYVRKKLGESR